MLSIVLAIAVTVVLTRAGHAVLCIALLCVALLFGLIKLPMFLVLLISVVVSQSFK